MDILLTQNYTVKVRIDEFITRNGTDKVIHWCVAGVPLKTDGSYGEPVARVNVVEPVDATLAGLTAPAGTIADVGGIPVDISGLTGLTVQAWLQWHGEAVCEANKGKIAAILKGE